MRAALAELHAAARHRRPGLLARLAQPLQERVHGPARRSPATASRPRASTAASSPRPRTRRLRDGFPKRLGTGGEAPIRYADLNGDNAQELIVPTEDGTIHAYEPNGSELPGLAGAHPDPDVGRTATTSARLRRAGGDDAAARAAARRRWSPTSTATARPRSSTPPAPTSTPGSPTARRVPGFPVASNLRLLRARRTRASRSHHPKCGFLASPAVGRLEGPSKPLDIVVPALDGHLYAFDGDGNAAARLPGRSSSTRRSPAERADDRRVDQRAGDRRPRTATASDDVVVATNETYGAGPAPATTSAAARPGPDRRCSPTRPAAPRASTRSTARPASSCPAGRSSSNGAIQDTLPLIGPGQDPAIAKIGGQTADRRLDHRLGDDRGVYDADGSLDPQRRSRAPTARLRRDRPHRHDQPLRVGLDRQAARPPATPAIVKYGLVAQPTSANLLLVGQNVPYNHLIGAYDADHRRAAAGLPADHRRLPVPLLLRHRQGRHGSARRTRSSPAPGSGCCTPTTARPASTSPGFPKVTGGWLFAPAALSDDGRMADITREGYLFEWDLPNLAELPDRVALVPPRPAADRQLRPRRHPALGARPASRLSGRDAELQRARRRLRLRHRRPLRDRHLGLADRADATSPRATPLADPPDARRRRRRAQTYALPAHQRYVAIRAVDEAGNVGPPSTRPRVAARRRSGRRRSP